MKSGLVIQGPIWSPGYGPYEFKEDGSLQRQWIDFNSANNIKQMVTQACDFFDYVILVTWKNTERESDLSGLEKSENFLTIELEENSFLESKAREGCHKYHQIFTTHAGAAKLNELGATLIAKCRTDHTLNMELIYNATLNHEKYNYYALGVPNINLFEADRLTDFYLVGNASVIEEMCATYLVEPEIFVDTHKDYFYKFGQFLQTKSTIRSSYSSILSRNSNFRIASAWSEIYYPLNPKIFEDFHWRGERVNFHLNRWVRWFFVLHGKNQFRLSYAPLLNFFILGLARILKRPLIRYTSSFTYKRFRRNALNGKFFK